MSIFYNEEEVEESESNTNMTNYTIEHNDGPPVDTTIKSSTYFSNSFSLNINDYEMIDDPEYYSPNDQKVCAFLDKLKIDYLDAPYELVIQYVKIAIKYLTIKLKFPLIRCFYKNSYYVYYFNLETNEMDCENKCEIDAEKELKYIKDEYYRNEKINKRIKKNINSTKEYQMKLFSENSIDNDKIININLSNEIKDLKVNKCNFRKNIEENDEKKDDNNQNNKIEYKNFTYIEKLNKLKSKLRALEIENIKLKQENNKLKQKQQNKIILSQ